MMADICNLTTTYQDQTAVPTTYTTVFFYAAHATC